MINFYRRYLKNAAKTQAPLHDLQKKAKKKDRRKIPWTESTIKIFEQCKSDLAKAALLSYPKSGLPLSLCADASDFAIGSVLQQFGVPATIITDQGRQFESQSSRKIAAICGAKVGHTTPYHPQCNGKVQRLHRTLKGVTKAHNNIKRTESLPTVLLGLRAALRPDVNHIIAQMAYGTCIKLPGEFFDQPTVNMDPQNFVTKLQQHMEDIKPLKPSSTRKQKIFVYKELKSCLHVFASEYFCGQIKTCLFVRADHDNGQTTAEHKNATPNSVDPHLMSDKQPTTSSGRKINRPVRFRE
ncbi:retrovirus-related Pol polyprotein from transposon opus [Nephila pilipes]|uniref:Retrovirus-related Pol polyprotein from transposon opus n=1 Tax=Nephila pilipes TaxID=299642 RepID=A0A8X6P4F2_NEPPI|nr:retrovirus-related Pol polyprotein from transposon opus [Nephila pilipes]